ncbi:MAG: 2-hydroxyacyl-CoA dehydratase [Peptococcaceae bacterium]|jgi:benzoyl-CoA reductase subunit B|nr:2-hydroxyacyl-CoA dehydratase [Peptococcaceae bacterium]
MTKQLWETRPLEIWQRAKELRAQWEHSIEEKDKLVGQGQTYAGDWSACFPAIRVIEDNPVGAKMASDSDEFSRICRLAMESRGWGREICGYHLNCWGAQFLGHQRDGSGFPYRDFVVPFPDVCDQHAKRGQQPMDLSPIPRWQGDYPMYIGPRDAAREEALVDHRVYCLQKELNDIERVFDQKFDDGRYARLIRERSIQHGYMSEVLFLMANVPTPISVKDLYSFYTMGGLTKLAPEVVTDFFRALRDEIKWRADNQIAAVGNERYRWMEVHPPAWHYLRYYRYMEQYGAVCIGSPYTHAGGGAQVEQKPDGTWGSRETVEYPEDTPMLTREDVTRIALTPDARAPYHFKIDEYLRPQSLIEFARFYKCDGALLPIWRGGVGCDMWRKEQARRLKEAGVSVMHYEGSQPGDRTDLDEHGFLDRLDIWMESQGLEKLV